MHRVTRQEYAEPVAKGLSLIPERIRSIVEDVDILTEIDPGFVGLHHFKNASYGREYKNTAHVAYEFHQLHMPKANRAITLFLPGVVSTRTIVHEMGHVLHGRINFEMSAVPVTQYGKTTPFEAFAESFTAWVMPPGSGYDEAKDRMYKYDTKLVEFFERISE